MDWFGTVLLTVAVFGTPLACWLLLARVRVVRWAVAAVLVLLVAALVASGRIWPPAFLELLVGFATVSVAVVAAGRLWERRRGPDRPAPHATRRGGVLLLGAWLAVTVLCCTPLTARMMNEPSLLADDWVLPLPEGLVVLGTTEGDCGSGSCTRTIVIGSRSAASGEEVGLLVVEHLRQRHEWWHPPLSCLPKGWLLVRSEACIQVTVTSPHQVTVSLTGVRGAQPQRSGSPPRLPR